MLKKSLLALSALAAIATLCLTAGCESSGSKGGSNSNVVGVWKITNFIDPISKRNDVHSGLYWHFREDGTVSLDNSPSFQGRRPGTYKVKGNTITGDGRNPAEGNTRAPNPNNYAIKFTVEGDVLTGDFVEYWGPNKTIWLRAVKQ